MDRNHVKDEDYIKDYLLLDQQLSIIQIWQRHLKSIFCFTTIEANTETVTGEWET